MMHIARQIIAVGFVALAGVRVDAQTTGTRNRASDRFDELVANELDQLRGLFPPSPTDETIARQVAHRDAAFYNVAVETPAVDPSAGLTAAERAAVVVSTSVEDAKAGVVVAPFAFARRDALRGVTLTVAAFDTGATRFGFGYVYEHRAVARAADLDLQCPLDKPQTRRDLERLREAFIETCTGVVAAIDPSTLGCDDEPEDRAKTICRTEVNAGRAACGLDQPFEPKRDPVSTVTGAKGSIGSFIDRAEKKSIFVAPAQQGSVKAVRDFQAPRPLDCFTTKAVAAAVTKWAWNQPTHKVSVAGFVDVFPLTLGHNPEMLDDFENKQREARLDWAYAKQGFEIGVGTALAVAREDRGKALIGTLRPSIRLAKVAGSLDGEPLVDKDGKLRTTSSGALPPIVIVGVKGELGFATDPPDTDDAPLRDLTITLHVDIRYTENLAFRIGVPIEMKRVAAMADPTDIGRQWTIPAFVATVLKL